jgi:group I intron endonuclease
MAINPLNQSGIYCIRNLVSGHIYVGASVNIYQRWHTHKNCLKNNCHHSGKLQASWNEHGSSAFLFDVLEFVPVHSLLLREQHWMDTLNSTCPTNGMNIKTSRGSWTAPRTPEHCAKMSAANKGRKHSPESRENMSRAAKKRCQRMLALAHS